MASLLFVLVFLGGQPSDAAGAFDNAQGGVVVPDRPSSFLLDEASVFSAEEEAKLSEYLVRLERETGVEVYLMALLYSPTQGIEAFARKLGKHWIKSEYGFVFVYDLGGKELTFVASAGVQDCVLFPVQHSVFGEVVESLGGWNDPAEDLTIILELVGGELASRVASARKPRSIGLRTLAWLVPACLGGSLIFFWISFLQRPLMGEFTPESSGLPDGSAGFDPMSSFRFFPTAGVAERLGAVFCGGSPNEVSFRDREAALSSSGSSSSSEGLF